MKSDIRNILVETEGKWVSNSFNNMILINTSIGRIIRLQVAVVDPLASAVLLLLSLLFLLLEFPVDGLLDILGETGLLLQIDLKRRVKTL